MAEARACLGHADEPSRSRCWHTHVSISSGRSSRRPYRRRGSSFGNDHTRNTIGGHVACGVGGIEGDPRPTTRAKRCGATRRRYNLTAKQQRDDRPTRTRAQTSGQPMANAMLEIDAGSKRKRRRAAAHKQTATTHYTRNLPAHAATSVPAHSSPTPAQPAPPHPRAALRRSAARHAHMPPRRRAAAAPSATGQ